MKIKCDCREVDNIVMIGGSRYHFIRPYTGADMVCTVDDPEHAEKLLADPMFSVAHEEALAESDPDLGDPDDNDGDPDGFGEPVNDDELMAEKIALASKKYEDMTHDELISVYEGRFGKKSHPNTKHETLVKKLATMDATAP